MANVPSLDEAQVALSEQEEIVRPSCPSFQSRLQEAANRLKKADNEAQIEKLNPRTGSQQITSDSSLMGFADIQEEIVEPPINIKLWAAQLARSTRLNRGVRTIARNTVGIGFDVVPVEPFKDDTPEFEKRVVMQEAERVKAFFKSLNPDQPFETLMECVVMDEEATGNGYIEFTRTGDGQLSGAFHIPSVTVRILRNDRGYVQIRGGKKKFFKPFGEEKVMDATTGKYQGDRNFNVDRGQGQNGNALPLEKRATEILHFRLYHPMSDVYGLPRFISAGAAIAGNWLSSKRNMVFFKNDAVPRMAVLVSGGKLDPKSRKDLAAYLQEGQGEEQAHRVLVLQVEEEGTGVDEKGTTKLDLKPMTIGVTEDGSFLNYRTANDEEIREALGLSEVFFKSIKLTKASAVVAKATTDEQEFEPARKQKEHQLNQRVVSGDQGLGAKRVMLQFQRPETSDPLEKARVNQLYSNMAAVTPNEIRRQLGMDPFPPEQEWANWPLPVLLLALQDKANAQLIGRPEEEQDGNEGDDGEGEGEKPDEDGEEDGDEDGEDGGEDGEAERSVDPMTAVHSLTDSIRKLPAGGKLGNLGPAEMTR